MYTLARGNRSNDVLDFVDQVLGRYNARPVPNALAPYAVDVHEDADHYFIDAELPGFSEKEIEVTLEDGVLTIRAERIAQTDTKKGEPLHVERRWTTFHRSFTLPAAVNEAAVNATIENGVLHVTLDKREEVKPRKIAVTVGNGASKVVKPEPTQVKQ